MNITFAPRGILQIDDARIIYRNFSGIGGKYNREGDKNFAVVIPNIAYDQDEADYQRGIIEETDIRSVATVLLDQGWKVKIRPPREEGEEPFMYLPVKIKFNERGPHAYLETGRNMTKLDSESISILDDIDIASVDLDIRPYDWEVNGDTGRTAYLQSIRVVQEIDRFMARYAEEEHPEE